MIRRTRLAALPALLAHVLAPLVFVTPAGAAQISLGSIGESYRPPQIVVDGAGQGYASWAEGASGEALNYCRLPQGATGCSTRLSFPYPSGPSLGTDAGNSPFITAGGEVGLLDSRCCETSNQKFLLLSPNGGQSFSGPTKILSDNASGMGSNLIDLPAGALFAGSPEQLLSSGGGPVTGGGSFQATGLGVEATDPGWFTPQLESGSLSESVGLDGSTLVAVYTQASSPAYVVDWVRYLGSGSPNSASSWSAPQLLSPAPSLDSNAQLAGGPSGIFVARSIATPGDNEELVVQKFTGAGWTSPVVITKTASGERFGITQTPAGVVYVIWKDTSGELKYVIATSTAGTSFGSALTLPTRGDVEFPQIAVDSAGAGWATWTGDTSPDQAFALPIPPAPNSTKVGLSGGGSVSLGTPRQCVAPGASFTVTLGFQASKRKGSVYIKLSRVAFSVSGSRVKTVTHAPFRATLTIKASTTPGSKVTVRARATIKTHHGKPPTKSIYATVGVCG
jgi:hypothetical protein